MKTRHIVHHDEAIALNPRSAWFHRERGNTYQKMGKQELASADFAKAREFGAKQMRRGRPNAPERKHEKQPGGLPDGSRGLRSAERDDTPGLGPPWSRPRRGRRIARNEGAGTLPGCNFMADANRGSALALRPPATIWHRSAMLLPLVVVATLTCFAAWGETVRIPLPSEVVRYEREQPVFKTKELRKESCDALLKVLDGGRGVERLRRPVGSVCILPPEPAIWISMTLTNGNTYRLAISNGARVLTLPEGWFIPSAGGEIYRSLDEFTEDLRREILTAPKPIDYTVGMIDDGGTLSGIARLLYGDASKWRQIFDANRSVLKNPDIIQAGMKLTIPKLK